MHFWYLPTVDYPLWPCAGLTLLVLIPVTIWHERAWRRTLAEYGAARSAAGAVDPWPPEGMGALLGVQPWLLLTAATLLAMMTALGLAALLMWPRKVAFFDAPLNYFDRPYVAATVVAGIAAVVGAVAVGIDLMRWPWAGVARALRRATHAAPEKHAKLMSAALQADPGVERARQLSERPSTRRTLDGAKRRPRPSGRPPTRS
jgi:hypothetical protein